VGKKSPARTQGQFCNYLILLAEGVGFEPTDPFGPPDFKTGAFDRSATLPG